MCNEVAGARIRVHGILLLTGSAVMGPVCIPHLGLNYVFYVAFGVDDTRVFPHGSS